MAHPKSSPQILLTNDDGIAAPGLAALAEAMQELGDVTIIAPHEEMSACGHAISIKKTHALRPFHHNDRLFGHSFEATPADCVKFAVSKFLDHPPDLVVSGINPGPNYGSNVPYSGTVAGAIEAAILNLPGMAVSTTRPEPGEDPDFASASRAALEIGRLILAKGLAPRVALSLNVPALPHGEIRGYRVVPTGVFRIQDKFEEIDSAPDGAQQFSNMGKRFIHTPDASLCDDQIFKQGYAAITPLTFDMTAHDQLDLWRDRLDNQREYDGP